MKILQKRPDRDFRILNLTDPQLSDAEWEDGRKEGRLLNNTVSTLVERTAPDLITVTGDLAWAGNNESYRRLASLLDSFDIPWAPVFGNHDEQGNAPLNETAKILCAGGKCLLEEGDPALGYGNYLLGIEQDGRILHGLILMDSHDRKDYICLDGKTVRAWSDVLPGQIAWYKEQIAALKDAGAKESTVLLHIPLYTYREASNAAYKEGIDRNTVPPEEGAQKGFFNNGYEDSEGVMYEKIGSYPADNGFFDVIKDLGHTKTVLCGHEHINDFMITYKSVRLIYALKTGCGCYWDERLNGGTLLTIGANGVLTAKHIFVKPDFS